MRKITLLLTLLLCVAGTAWAQFTQKWTSTTAPWPNEVVDAASIPSGLTVCNENNHNDTDRQATRLALMPVTLSETGSVTVSFTYSSGDHALIVLGVDIIDERGNVVANHYEKKHAGGDREAEVYTLDMSSAAAGNYTLRYFVCSQANNHDLTNTNGNIAVTGLTKRKYTDVANASAIATDKAYILYTAKAGVRVNPAGTGLFALGEGSRSSELDAKCKFAFITDPADNTKKYLWSVSENGFVTKTGAISTQAADALTFDASSTSADTEDHDGLKIKFSTGSDKVFQVNSAFTGVVIGQSTNQSVQNTFHICEVGTFNNAEALALLNSRVSFTYSYRVNDSEYSNETFSNVFVGSAYPTPSPKKIFSYVELSNRPTGNVQATDNNQTFNVTCSTEPSASFGLSTSNYFGLSTRSGVKILKADYPTPALSITALGVRNWSEHDNYFWTLEGTWYEGYKLKSQSGKYLKSPTSAGNGTLATLTDNAAEATLFTVYENESKYLFCVKGTEAFLSDYQNNDYVVKHYIGLENNWNDAGTKFTAYQVNEATTVSEWKTLALATNNKKYVNFYPGDNTTDINACTTIQDCIDFEKAKMITFDPTKYYMFISTQDENQAVFVNYADPNESSYYLSCQNVGSNQVPYCWKFEEITDGDYAGKYNIKNANGLYFGKISYDQAMTLKEATSTTANNTTVYEPSTTDYVSVDGAFTLRWWQNTTTKDGTLARRQSTGTSWTDVNGRLGSWNMANQTNNNWYLLPVESIDLDITAAGWASVNLPFAVQMPAGVTAYAVTKVEGNTVYGEEIANGTVPANTPVFVAGTEGTKTLTILYDNEATYKGTNKLHGSTLPETVTAGQYYGLKANGSEASLVPYNLTTLPANKAVLEARYVPEAAEGGNAAELLFNFCGDATGIAPAISVGEKEVFYDLNGRVVAFPTNGVFVKSNGQKVLIK